LSARLPRSQSTSNCQLSCAHLSAPLQFFCPSAISWLGCSQSALLHSVTSFAVLPAFCQYSCSLSAQLYFVSSAAYLSALVYSVMQLICCDRPTARHQPSYKVQAPLQSVTSDAICLLSHDMSAWQQSRLSCNSSTQLSGQLQLVS